jgi:hypothetical protein
MAVGIALSIAMIASLLTRPLPANATAAPAH